MQLWRWVLLVALASGCTVSGRPSHEQGGGPAGADPMGDADPGDGDDDPNDTDPGDTDEPGGDADPIPAGDYTITTCAPSQAPLSGCEVTGSGAALVLEGRVLTPGNVLVHGRVRIEGNGVISCVGCDCELESARQVVCADAVISPGLINAHDHMGWMADRPYVAAAPSLRYEHRHDWRKGDSDEGEPKIPTEGGASSAAKIWGELRSVLVGATSINGSGIAPGLLRNLDRTDGQLGLGGGAVLYETFPLGDSGGVKRTADCAYPGIDDPAQVSAARAYTPHVAEGIDAAARNELACLSGTQSGGEQGISENTAIIHGIGLDAVDVAVLATLGGKLVWSPRSNISLYGETAPVTLYAALGVPIALGTDWMPSGSMSLARELACARELNERNFGGYFSSQALWRMVTVDAAQALGFAGVLGTLAPGAAGDVAVFAAAGRSPFESVVAAEPQDLLLVVRGGKVLAGSAPLVSGLAAGCDSLAVCGTDKQVCLQGDVGQDLESLRSATANIYPLFFCGPIDDEPSCVPSRAAAESQAGSSTYTGLPELDDQDGDGLGAADNCPTIFNPIRPVDLGSQPDNDGDGLGDVCDACPLDAGVVCTPPDPNDLDGDGVLAGVDVCPEVADPEQIDADADGKGDACDACPSEPNPGTAACPTTPYAVKLRLVGVGARVAMPDLVVVAQTAGGFVAQLDPSSPRFDATLGARHSGIFVYTATAARPAAGSRIDIATARVDTYYGQLELVAPVWTQTASDVWLEPTLASEADILGEAAGASSPFEAVLVRLERAEIAEVAPPPGTGDTGAAEVALASGLRVDDFAGYALPAPVAGDVYAPLTGVVLYRNGLLKLLPRGAEDAVLVQGELRGFSLGQGFVREGAAQPIAGALELIFSGPLPQDADIAIVSSNPAALHVAGDHLLVPAGQSRALVPLVAIAADPTPVVLTATHDGASVGTALRVLGAEEPAHLVRLIPTPIEVRVSEQVLVQVELDVPAPPAGVEVLLAITPAELATVSASVIVPADALSATVVLTAGVQGGSGTLAATAGDALLESPLAIVELLPLGLDGYTLEQAASAVSLALPAGITLAPGDHLVIGRDADRAAFEAFWGTTLPAGAVYIDSAGAFPLLNGQETFTIRDPAAVALDGPTAPLVAGNCYARLPATGTAGEIGSWSVATAGGDTATPGVHTVAEDVVGLVVSEICDAPGTGNFVFEFVELHYAGSPAP